MELTQTSIDVEYEVEQHQLTPNELVISADDILAHVLEVSELCRNMSEFGINGSDLKDFDTIARLLASMVRDHSTISREALARVLDALATRAGAHATVLSDRYLALQPKRVALTLSQALSLATAARHTSAIYDTVSWLLHSVGMPNPSTHFPNISWVNDPWPDSLDRLMMTLDDPPGPRTLVGCLSAMGIYASGAEFYEIVSQRVSRIRRADSEAHAAVNLMLLREDLARLLASEAEAAAFLGSLYAVLDAMLEQSHPIPENRESQLRFCLSRQNQIKHMFIITHRHHKQLALELADVFPDLVDSSAETASYLKDAARNFEQLRQRARPHAVSGVQTSLGQAAEPESPSSRPPVPMKMVPVDRQSLPMNDLADLYSLVRILKSSCREVFLCPNGSTAYPEFENLKKVAVDGTSAPLHLAIDMDPHARLANALEAFLRKEFEAVHYAATNFDAWISACIGVSLAWSTSVATWALRLYDKVQTRKAAQEILVRLTRAVFPQVWIPSDLQDFDTVLNELASRACQPSQQ